MVNEPKKGFWINLQIIWSCLVYYG